MFVGGALRSFERYLRETNSMSGSLVPGPHPLTRSPDPFPRERVGSGHETNVWMFSISASLNPPSIPSLSSHPSLPPSLYTQA